MILTKKDRSKVAKVCFYCDLHTSELRNVCIESRNVFEICMRIPGTTSRAFFYPKHDYPENSFTEIVDAIRIEATRYMTAKLERLNRTDVPVVVNLTGVK